MSAKGVSAPDLARLSGVTYEHVRKLLMGHCLPSNETLQRLCGALGLNEKQMRKRVMQDKMIFQFGDAAWEAAGIDPRVAPCYILFPLMTREERELFIVQLKAMAEANRTRGISGSTAPKNE